VKTKLTREEQEISDSFEKEEWVPVKNLSRRKTDLMKYTRNTLKSVKNKVSRI
jgi:hypothetical protein